jgi:hypothetical protein
MAAAVFWRCRSCASIKTWPTFVLMVAGFRRRLVGFLVNSKPPVAHLPFGLER